MSLRFLPAGFRGLCGILVMLFGMGCGGKKVAEPVEPLWPEWKSRFVSPEGRVIDTGNQNISHSEGQGYGLLLAESAGDREAFTSIWNWTRTHLQVRGDSLFAWKWRPVGNSGLVADDNNASDGDMLIAWGLLRGAERWEEDAWKKEALAILTAVKSKCLRPSAAGLLLLPGTKGFEHPEGITVNLSYWLFPAFQEFAKVDASPEWGQLEQSGKALMERGRFGTWALPPDWMQIDGETIRTAPNFPPEFGYNAIRVPLNALWGRLESENLYTPFRSYAGSFLEASGIRATVDLLSNQPGPNPALPGMLSIYRLTAGSGDLRPPFARPYLSIAADEVYYSAALGMLANLAARDALAD